MSAQVFSYRKQNTDYSLYLSIISLLSHVTLQNCWICPCRMMSTESANSFTLIGEASDGGTMENLSRRLKVKSIILAGSRQNHKMVVIYLGTELAVPRDNFASDPVPPRWPATCLTSCRARQMWTTRCVRNALTPCWTTWTRSSTSRRTNVRITSEPVHNKVKSLCFQTKGFSVRVCTYK